MDSWLEKLLQITHQALIHCRKYDLDMQFDFQYYLFQHGINERLVRSMEINYLKEFVVLAQTGNFLEAADILYSSQSTLSKHIKKAKYKKNYLGIKRFQKRI